MRSINEIIKESKEWNPNGFKHHKDAYNSFIKWYDKQLKYMNEDEIVDMLTIIIQDIKDHELKELK